MKLLFSFLSNDEQRGKLIAVIMSTFLFITISLSLIFYLISFNRKKFKKKFINKKIIISIISVLFLNVPFLILSYVFGFYIEYTNNKIMISLISISFIVTILVGIFLFLFLQIIAIGITDQEINFLGERILISNINKIQKHEKFKQLIIFYTEGIKSQKKCKYSLNSKACNFILKNINYLNKELEILTIKEYNNSLNLKKRK